MKTLVTGGAGFIGRWVVKKLFENHEVVALDNLSNGTLENIVEFREKNSFKFLEGDIQNCDLVNRACKGTQVCIHLAANNSVQESLNNPKATFNNNIIGSYNVLEACRKNDVKLVLVGTCLVYDLASSQPINEEHPIKPASPYAASKVAAENMAISYYYGYGLPVLILRPFNTYGPNQKSTGEGGVISIFIKRHLEGKDIIIYGDGEQTRDFLYVEDCAEFITKAAFSEKAVGEVINGGSGTDISINDLALMICKDKSRIKHVPHIHPQSEIRKLVCDSSKARRLLEWKPKTPLENGIKKTTEWIESMI